MEYYCIMVQSGSEERFRDSAAQSLSGENGGRIYFFRKKMRTSRGKEFEEPVFPGYVFLETESLSPAAVSAIKNTKGFYHFLRSNSEMTRLSGGDLEIVEQFRKSGERLGFSKLYFEPERRIVVTEGPLKGLEGKIVGVNKRRRRITVQLDMLSQIKRIDLMYDLVDTVKTGD